MYFYSAGKKFISKFSGPFSVNKDCDILKALDINKTSKSSSNQWLVTESCHKAELSLAWKRELSKYRNH